MTTLAALLLWSAALIPARGELVIDHWTSPDRSAIITAWSVLDHLPSNGWIPIGLTISNTADHPQQWSVNASLQYWSNLRSRCTDSHTVTVAGGTTQRIDLLIPAVSTFGSRYVNGTVTLTGSAPGVGRFEFTQQLTSRTTGSSRLSAARIVMTQQSQQSFGHRLKALEEEQGRALWLSALNTTRLPTNAMAWEGINTFAFTVDEWVDLPVPVRTAILDRVAANAYLFILGDASRVSGRAFPFLSYPSDGDRFRHGGFLRTVATDGHNVKSYAWGAGMVFTAGAGERAPADAWLQLLNSFSRSKAYDPASQYSDRHDAAKVLAAIGEPSIPVTLIMVLLIVFGTLVGPLNLFIFARNSRRYLLFLTTPLICLGAFLATLLIILFRDGTGGTGHRHALVMLLPGENRAVIRQEQISRTGLLLNHNVPRPDGQGMMLLISGHDGSAFSGVLHQQPGNYSGNWFISRESQSHFITAAEASRAGITWVNASDPNALPQLQSALPEVASPLYFHYGAAVYRADSIAPGETVELTAATAAEWEEWLKATAAPLGPILADSLRALPQSDGFFFAKVAANELAPRPSLPALKFTNESIIFTGAVK